ncbi:hypothetical protein RHGRI_027249 [Rhododendron griersonianum]|uniref:Uncharacterized protein n=1 Tax=Rhododendron griersonianum TaxID=479676 RepID=A0AAV6IVQ9_9ERIC|nr:hypothetical protein RHGRI_027249 [Rhododendron griersonianum]
MKQSALTLVMFDQLIMLFHGLGSVFLQVNYPYAGAGVSVVMVVSFVSAFMVAYMVTLNKIERMSEFEKDLQRRQMELQNEVTCFGAKIQPPSNGELENLASKGAFRGALDSIDSLRKGAVALQEDITRILELSNSKNIRLKSLSQVALWASGGLDPSARCSSTKERKKWPSCER